MKKNLMICPLCEQYVEDDKIVLVIHQLDVGICPECADALPVPEIPKELEVRDDGIRTCPHCGIGEYNIFKQEKYCYACSSALAIYGELP